MKRILLALLALVAIAINIFAMTGCDMFGGNGGSGNNSDFVLPDGTTYDGSEVTITFYHTMSATKLQPHLENAIVEFNKLYPNIHIEHQQVGGYDDVTDQIQKEITGGNQPNIAYCYPDHVATYNVAKKVVALDSLINSTTVVNGADGYTEILGLTAEQKADFIKGYYDEGAVYDDKGTMYTLPLSKSTEILYYNATFFEKEGLTVPTTWDEMEAVCKTIKERYPNSIPLGYDSEANWFITMCEQYGSGYTSLEEGNHFLFDNETNRAFVKRFNDWYQKGYVTTEELSGGYTSDLFTNTDPEATTCYMVIGSSGGASYQTPPTDDNGKNLFTTAITTVPQVDPSKPKVISQGPSLCIFKDDNIQEVIASWLFVKYLTTNAAFQAQFSMASGYAPVIKSVQENAVYKKWLETANGVNNLQALAVKVALAQEPAYYVSPAFSGSSEARKQVGIIMQDVLVATGDVDAVIDAKFKAAVDECKYKAGE